MLPLFKNGCFWVGVIVNIVLLTLAIYTAQSGKPFAVRVSLLVAFLLAFIFVVTISLGHLESPARRRNNYIVPLTDEELELYDLPASRPATINNELDDEEAYRQLLATRPLPPTPAASFPRPSTPFPVLATPLSDPFMVTNNTATDMERPTTLQDGRTVRLVPESSVASRV